MNARYLLAAALGCWLFAGCTFQDTRKHCSRDSQCDGDRCYDGFCVQRPPSQSNIGGQGDKGDPSAAGEGGGGDTRSDSGTAGKGGAGSSNQDSGSTECSGDAMRSCTANWEDATALGGCGAGMQQCVNGSWGSCTPERMMITTESCNGLDDDCDGKTDEESDVRCFPGDARGCEANAQGKLNCKGLCQAGTQKCERGSLQSCEGSVVAAAVDDCSTPRIDENCDGTLNDKCACMGSATMNCYAGPADTEGVGICKGGKQQCANGQWGACDGAVLPQLEICNGKDDDCNGMVDDVVGVGTRCTVAGKLGVCSEGMFQCIAGNPVLTCVATSPNTAPETCDGKDNDCNGMIDDVPTSVTNTDPMNCGACKKACAATDKCCAGACVNSNTDEKNCGKCDNPCMGTAMCMNGMCMSMQPADAGAMCDAMRPCASGQLCCNGTCVPNDLSNCGKCGTKCTGTVPACCKDSCVDLSTSTTHCGKCDNVCPTVDGGAACCAATTAPGMFECRSGTNACQ